MNGKNPIARPDYLAFLLLLASVIWFDREMISTNLVPFFRDLGPMFYPMRFSLAESFKAGELPLWDRHMGMGFPLLANFQSGVFYPPNLIYLILPFFTAVRSLFLLHYLIAATGCYLLIRQWKYPPYLAILGSLLFTLGGTVVSLSNLLNHFQTAVWLPWVIYMGERAIRTASWKSFVGLTVALLVQFLAGSPELYAMSMGLLLVDGLTIKAVEGNLPHQKTLLILVAANVLTVGLAMVQILPTVELFQESRGSVSVPYSIASLWSLRPMSLFNIFFPYGEVDPSLVSGTRLFFSSDIPFLVSHYMGAISLFGLYLSFYYCSVKEKSLLFGILGLSIILALGDHTPVYPFLYRLVPFFSVFRYPEKFFFLTHAVLVFVTLRGLNGLLREDHPPPRGSMFVTCSLFLLLPLLYLFINLETSFFTRLIVSATQSSLAFPAGGKSASGFLFYLERQMFLVMGILLLLVLWKKGKLRSVLFQPLIVALVFLDLSSANRSYRYLLDPSFVFHGEKTISSRDPEPHRIFFYPGTSSLHPSEYVTYEGQSFAELNFLSYKKLVPYTDIFHGFDYMQVLDPLRTWPYVVFLYVADQLPPAALFRLLGTLNVKYVIGPNSLPPGNISLVRHIPEFPAWLYRINDEVPRAYVVTKATAETDAVTVLKRLSSPDFEPLREVILERSFLIPTHGDSRSQPEIVHYSNQSVTLKASLNGAGFLVLANFFYPGWRVYVDGMEKEVLRANLFFRAVSLPTGEHLVEFRYQPLSFTIGLAISLITFVGTLLGFLFYHYRYSRSSGEIR